MAQGSLNQRDLKAPDFPVKVQPRPDVWNDDRFREFQAPDGLQGRRKMLVQIIKHFGFSPDTVCAFALGGAENSSGLFHNSPAKSFPSVTLKLIGPRAGQGGTLDGRVVYCCWCPCNAHGTALTILLEKLGVVFKEK